MLRNMNALQLYFDARPSLTQAEFGAVIGTTAASVSRLCSGNMRPSLDLAHRIERATGGEVPTETWERGGSSGEHASCDTTAPETNAPDKFQENIGAAA